MVRLKCDRCGAETTENDHPEVLNAWDQMKLSGTSPARDLCPHCTYSLGEWFKAAAPKSEPAHDEN